MEKTTENLESIGNLLFGNQWQTDLANLMGVESRTVRRWASGSTIPNGVWFELKNHMRARQSDIERKLAYMDGKRFARIVLDFEQIKTFKRAISNGISHLRGNVLVRVPNAMPPTDDPCEPSEPVSFSERAMQAPLIHALNQLSIIAQDIERCCSEKSSRGPVIMTLIPDDDVEDNDEMIVEFDATATGPSMLITLCMDASVANNDKPAAKLMCKLLES